MTGQARQRTETRQIPQLQLRASFAPDSLNEETRTVDVTWTTGARVKRGGYWSDPYWEELSLDPAHVRLDRLNNGAPYLDSHSSWRTDSVLAVVEKAWLEKGRGVATVRFPRAGINPDADRVFALIGERILRQVSVGYKVHRYEEYRDETTDLKVRRAVDWEPVEISQVPIGADAGASVRAEGADTNPCELVELVEESRTMADTNDTSTATTAAPAAPAAEQRSQVDEAAIRAEERKRTLDIQRTGRTLGLDAELVEEHVRKGTSLAEFQRLAIEQYGERAPIVSDRARPVLSAGDDERDKWMRCAEHWLIMRSGYSQVHVDAASKRGEKLVLEPGIFRGMTLMEMATECLERAGVQWKGRGRMERMGLALTTRSAGQHATGDFPVLLENVMHKTLLANQAIQPDKWRKFCVIGTMSDFRAHNRYRQGGLGKLDDVAEGGVFLLKEIPDGEKETITLATKGNRIAVTRQMLINDDMGAFMSLAAKLGRAAGLTPEIMFFALLAQNAGLGPLMSDAKTLFHNDHNNIVTQTALTVDGLEKDRVALGAQADPGAGQELLDLSPWALLLSNAIGGEARVILKSEYDHDGTKLRKPNKVAGIIAPENIVDTARMTGTRRYMFADPNIEPVFEAGFLDGQQQPVIETKDGWEIDGTEIKVRYDVVIDAIGWRGAVTNAG